MGRRKSWVLAAGMFVLGLASGCQTQNPETGLTLPTPWYLRHTPQYFPPTPDYPLPRETEALERASAVQVPAQFVPGAPGGPGGF